MGEELLCFLTDRNINLELELVGQVMRYNNQLAITFRTQCFNFGVVFTFEGVYHDQ